MLATRTAEGNLDSGWTAFLNSEPRSLLTQLLRLSLKRLFTSGNMDRSARTAVGVDS